MRSWIDSEKFEVEVELSICSCQFPKSTGLEAKLKLSRALAVKIGENQNDTSFKSSRAIELNLVVPLRDCSKLLSKMDSLYQICLKMLHSTKAIIFML